MDLELGAGKIRFVPKERGLRMITNMKSATKLVSLIATFSWVVINVFRQVSNATDESFQEQKVNSNDKLETALNVLQYELVKSPSNYISFQTYRVHNRIAIQISLVAQY